MSQLPYKPLWRAGSYMSSGIRQGNILDQNPDVDLYGINTVPLYTQVLSNIYLNPLGATSTWIVAAATPVTGTTALTLSPNVIGTSTFLSTFNTFPNGIGNAIALDVPRLLNYYIEAAGGGGNITFQTTGYDYRYQPIYETVEITNTGATFPIGARGRVAFAYIKSITAISSAGTVDVHVTASNAFGLDYYVGNPALVSVQSDLLTPLSGTYTASSGTTFNVPLNTLKISSIVQATYISGAASPNPIQTAYTEISSGASFQADTGTNGLVFGYTLIPNQPSIQTGVVTNPNTGVYDDARGVVVLNYDTVGSAMTDPTGVIVRSTIMITYPVYGAFGGNNDQAQLFGATPTPPL